MPSELDFDHAATTPVAPAVLAAMLPFFAEQAANPSSVHRAGQRARAALEEARDRVGAAIGASGREIVFTSGATEADNLALRSVMAAAPGKRLVTSRLEHAAVNETVRSLAASGFEIDYVETTRSGEITPEAVAELLTPDVALVALMAVNNETGVCTDIAAIATLAHEVGALVFCDAVQAFGFEPLHVDALGVDLLSLSAHKVYGPKGVGALFLRRPLELTPLLTGGSQERGVRPGTHNLPAIVGFGVAASEADERCLRDGERLRTLRDRLERQLLAIDGVTVNGGGASRGPKHSNVAVEGVDGDTLRLLLDDLGLLISAGSACAAGSLEASHVLLAMGLDRHLARSSVRFSLGRDSDEAGIDDAAGRFAQAVARCRAFAG